MIIPSYITRMLALVILLLLTIACTLSTSKTIRSAGSNEVTASSFIWPCLESPHSAPMWNLKKIDPNVRDFFAKIASREGSNIESFLMPLAENYSRDSFTLDDFSAILRSSVILLHNKKLASADIHIDSSEPHFGAGDGEPLILYLDPTCGTCEKLMRTLIQGQEACPEHFPPVIFRPLPSNEKPSLRASAMLEYIRQNDPASYVSAVIESVHLLSSNQDLLNDLLRDYGLFQSGDVAARQMEKIEGEIKAKKEMVPLRGQAAPLLIYRGRIIERERGLEGDLPFNPLRDWEILLATIRMIEATDALEDH